MIEHLHFLRPYWLLMLLPLAWMLWRYWQRQQRGGAWQSVCDSHLLPHLLVATSARTNRAPILVLAAAGLLSVIALAGPAWSQIPQPVYHNNAATVVLLSLSETMNATDVKPTRLERAKLKLLDFLQRQREGQTALIAFAGEAYVVSPLTDDAATIESLVNSLESNTMPVAGYNLSEALHKADALLDQDGVYKGGRILLISDSAGNHNALQQAAALQRKDRVLSILAVGTQQGSPITATGGGFVKNNDGAILIPTLNRPALQQLATAGHGRFVTLTNNDDDLNTLWPSTQAAMFKLQGEKHAADVWREEGPWLLLVVLPLTALLWRQGWLAVIVLAVMLQPHPVQASTWDDLWTRPDQQAYRALQQGDAKTAASLFKDPRWRSAAQYRAGDYAAAAAGFGSEHSPDALYNQGNALARAGKLAEAAQNYRKVLQQQPTNQDAQHNLKIVEDLLKQQQQNKHSAQNNDKHDQQQGKDQNKQSGQHQQAQQGQSNQAKQNEQNGQAGQDQESQQDKSTQQHASEQQKQTGQNQSGNSQQQKDKQAGQPDKTQQAQDKQAGTDKDAALQQAKSEQTDKQQAEKNQTETAQDQHAGTVAENAKAKTESAQALEQWLRRIPDDPGGLLRRKFLYLHQQREQAGSNDGNE